MGCYADVIEKVLDSMDHNEAMSILASTAASLRDRAQPQDDDDDFFRKVKRVTDDFIVEVTHKEAVRREEFEAK